MTSQKPAPPMDRLDAIKWFITRFIRKQSARTWMLRIQGIDNDYSQDAKRKLTTTQLRQHSAYAIAIARIDINVWQIVPALPAADWLSGIICYTEGAGFSYCSTQPPEGLFERQPNVQQPGDSQKNGTSPEAPTMGYALLPRKRDRRRPYRRTHLRSGRRRRNHPRYRANHRKGVQTTPKDPE